MPDLFVESFFLFRPHHRKHTLPEWAAEVPAIRAMEREPLPLTAPATFITGENGMGKSTLIEAIAVGCGFDLQGGPYGVQPTTGYTAHNDPRIGESPFKGIAAVIRGSRPMQGYYLRAETHINSHSNVPLSHGESVMHTIGTYFHANGLYILDEPEAGLSIPRQMALLAELHALVRGGAQIIVSTHSPILLSLPGAAIWEIIEAGIAPATLRDTTAFRATRDFFEDPHGIAAFMQETMSEEYRRLG
ncbi:MULTISPECIES: AAA family ATPase [unclassified Corynebacterium]|uniref:AAA family ATPase n=1 Tax=unclassified Corynebacterium TaxID=2624378 RepID=UPI0029CA8F67|nr:MULTISPECIES: AAA family ATPase [unclassified Corynebacterium]WPF66999.1 AAA family ATPase [Corynebacterium sp. 22KM0430]WPF69487.1 AAA family ATPase [Corynebacterium sp. 21KM1197]